MTNGHVTDHIRFKIGIRVDAQDKIAITLFSDKVIAVSIRRYDIIPCSDQVQRFIAQTHWVVVKREHGNTYFLFEGESNSEEQANNKLLASPQALEAGQLAVETALWLWGEWCPELRDKYQPGWVIPINPINGDDSWC